MKNIIILMVCMLSGCDVITSGYDKNDYDLFDNHTKMKVNLVVNVDMEVDYFVSKWEKTKECTGLSYYPAPYIAVIDNIDGFDGFYFYKDHVIVVEWAKMITGDILEHEMIHFLLNRNGLHSSGHNSIEFYECAPFSTGGKHFKDREIVLY